MAKEVFKTRNILTNC